MDVSKLVKTMNAFIDLGKPFAKPMCPMKEGLIPDNPGQTVAFAISNCGVQELNGPWKKAGWIRDRPQYMKIDEEDAVMEWSDSRKAWRIFIDDTWFGYGRKTLFLNKNNIYTVPITGWESVDGSEPVPTITRHPWSSWR